MQSKDLLLIKNQMLSTFWEIRYLTKLLELNTVISTKLLEPNSTSEPSTQVEPDGKFGPMAPAMAFKAQYGIELTQLDEWIEELRKTEEA